MHVATHQFPLRATTVEPSRPDGRGRSGGFTLVEVLLAMVLITFGVLAAAPMFLLAVRGNVVSGDIGTMSAVTQDRLEILRASDFSTLTAGGNLGANISVGGVPYYDDSQPTHVVRWQIVDNLVPAGTKSITVRSLVTVPGGNGNPQEISMTTLRSD